MDLRIPQIIKLSEMFYKFEVEISLKVLSAGSCCERGSDLVDRFCSWESLAKVSNS